MTAIIQRTIRIAAMPQLNMAFIVPRPLRALAKARQG